MDFWEECQKAVDKLIQWKEWDKPVIIDGVCMPATLAQQASAKEV